MKSKRQSKPKKNTVLKVNKSNELMKFLIEKLPGKSRNNIKSLLVHNQISVNGKVITKYNHPIEEGQEVMINNNKVRVEKETNDIKILFEDKHLIVVVKKTGLLSVATDNERENTVYNYLKAHVKNEDPKNKIFVVHRLDKDTSGVMLFAKTEEVQQILQTNWKKLVKERIYVAVVEGKIDKKHDTIVSWLKENKAYVTYSSPTPNDGKKAVSFYKVLKKNKNFSLVEVKIQTGRKNQIRVHMQDIGHSIIGDKKYGATKNPIHRLGLHARLITFTHPITEEVLSFETRIPSKFTNLF